MDGATTVRLEGNVYASWSGAARGDLRPGGPSHADGSPLAAFAADVAAATATRVDEVVWVTQVHGRAVAEAGAALLPAGLDGRPGCRNIGTADAVVAMDPGVALCILTADCGPLALASPEGIFAAVHAGWRGLLDGIVEATVGQMRARGATDIVGAIGPCIHVECYEFATSDLDLAASGYGEELRGCTTDGRPALDLVAGMQAAMRACGVQAVDGADVCTSCGGGYYSHRARHDTGRQALLVWMGSPGSEA